MSIPGGLPRIRPLNRVPGFKRLRELRCFSEVHEMLISGWSCREVAEFIQNVKGEYTDVQSSSLEATLNDYRNSLPGSVLVQATQPRVHQAAVKKIGKMLNELEELHDLFKLQRGRIEIDLKTEQQIGKLFPTMTAEVRTAESILKTSAAIKAEMGFDNIVKDVDEDAALQTAVGRYGSEEMAEVLGNPESRRRLLNIVEKCTQLTRLVSDGSEDSLEPSEQEGDHA